MAEEPEKALDEMAEDTRIAREGIEAELKEDLDKVNDAGSPPKRPWWKVWARAITKPKATQAPLVTKAAGRRPARPELAVGLGARRSNARFVSRSSPRNPAWLRGFGALR
jgi:hypothetical protein